MYESFVEMHNMYEGACSSFISWPAWQPETRGRHFLNISDPYLLATLSYVPIANAAEEPLGRVGVPHDSLANHSPM